MKWSPHLGLMIEKFIPNTKTKGCLQTAGSFLNQVDTVGEGPYSVETSTRVSPMRPISPVCDTAPR